MTHRIAPLLLFLTCLLCISAYAYDFALPCGSGQTIYYKITSHTEPYTVEIVAQNEEAPYYATFPSGQMVIPPAVRYEKRTYTITSIGANAFYKCIRLSSIRSK